MAVRQLTREERYELVQVNALLLEVSKEIVRRLETGRWTHIGRRELTDQVGEVLERIGSMHA